MIFKQLRVVVIAMLLSVCGKVAAQNNDYPTDTVYHSVFGCDSFLLTANNTVYHSDTTVEIPNLVPVGGMIVTDVLDIYTITIGRSYDVKDTVAARVCRNNLPYVFSENFYYESGDYWIPAKTVMGCDSAMTLLKLQVLEGQRDTVNLSLCYNQSSVTYDGIPFTTAGTYNRPQGVDADGCPIVKTYVVTQYPLQIDTVYEEVCQNELPFYFMGNSYSAAGTYSVNYTASSGCNAIKVLVLTVRPSSNQTDTVNAVVCRTDLPYEYENRTYNTAGTYNIQKYNAYGCDSVLVTLNLTVTNPHTDTMTVTLCPDSFPYIYDSLHTFAAPASITSTTSQTRLAATIPCWCSMRMQRCGIR